MSSAIIRWVPKLFSPKCRFHPYPCWLLFPKPACAQCEFRRPYHMLHGFLVSMRFTSITLAPYSLLGNASLLYILFLFCFTVSAAYPQTIRANKTPRPCAWKNAENRYVQLHIEYESVLCSKYGGDAQTATPRIVSVIREAEQPFEEKTCIRLNVSSVTAHCDRSKDPYGYLHLNEPKKSRFILSQFCNRWMRSNNSPQFGVALFLTGFSSGDTAVGTAFVQGACSATRPCAWVQGLEKETIAHELGHSFNAPHTNGPDLMAGSLSYATQFYFASSSAKIMTSFADSKSCGFRTDGSDGLVKGTDGGDGFGNDEIFISFFNRRFLIVLGAILAVVATITIITSVGRVIKRRIGGV